MKSNPFKVSAFALVTLNTPVYKMITKPDRRVSIVITPWFLMLGYNNIHFETQLSFIYRHNLWVYVCDR